MGGYGMTREEQIENAAIREQRLLMESSDWRSGFKSGVRWADAHPNLTEEEQVGMGGLGIEWQKQALIKKACEWIKNNKHLHKELSFGSLSTDWNKFIKEFKKAMEE